MNRLRGEITVFLALSSVLIFSFICSCLEAGRAYELNSLSEAAAVSAIESVFAAYNGTVLDEYGLLICQGTEGGDPVWLKEVERFLEKYLMPDIGTRFVGDDYLYIEEIETKEEWSVHITDANGRVFAREMKDYMTSAGLAVLLQEVLARFGLYSEEDGLRLTELLSGLLTDKDSSIEGILSSYKDLQEEAAQLQELLEDDDSSGGSGGQQGDGDMSADILEQLKAIRDNGLIAVLTGSQTLSDYQYQGSSLPSQLSESDKSRNLLLEFQEIPLLDHFLAGEYLIAKMDSFIAHSGKGASYEAEYVLSGKESDKAALEFVAGEILLIRVGLNLAYLMTDAEKLAEAEALAASILVLLALPELIIPLKWLLVTAWALVESIVDVRTLLKGKKVPLWKSKSSWCLLSLGLDLDAENNSGKGFGYEDYLRLLFYLGDREEEYYRMMDVIQLRTCLNDKNFVLKDYMVYASYSVTVRTSYLYICPPLTSFFGEEEEGQKYKKTAAYSYGRR